VDLPGPVTGIAGGAGTDIWAHDPAGKLYVVDTRRMALSGTATLPGATLQMSYITLRKGEGYACF
jgi:hypothetical protein